MKTIPDHGCFCSLLAMVLLAGLGLCRASADSYFDQHLHGQLFGELDPKACGGDGGIRVYGVMPNPFNGELIFSEDYYMVCLRPDKSTRDLHVLSDGIYRCNGEKNILVIPASKFTYFPAATPRLPVARNSSGVARAKVAAADDPDEIAIPVSNDADSFALTTDGRYAVAVGANSATPVALVELAKRKEVSKFAADSNVTWAETLDDGESVMILQNVPPANDQNRLRRLRIVNGKLVDTGESLAAATLAPSFADYRFKKVFAVAGSKVGVAIAEFGNPQIVTFGIPGLQVLDTLSGAGGHSGAVNCAGDRFYVRAGSQIRGYTLDPVTGALGDTPVLTINGVGEVDQATVGSFGNALEVTNDGAALIVSEGTDFPNSPPTARTTLFSTTTGARLDGVDSSTQGTGAGPTLLGAISCGAAAMQPGASTVLFATGDTPPGALGGAGQPPTDAVLASFGAPAIDAAGKVAFTAKWTSATAGKGSGIFTSDGTAAIVGGSVPGVNDAKFKALTDPLIAGGRVAFRATLAGVPAAQATAVMSDAPGGTLEAVAQTGFASPSDDGAIFKSFDAIGLDGASVGFLAKVVASPATDVGLWAKDATHPLTLLLRENQMIGVQQIKTIVAFKIGNGSPGQGRGWITAAATGTQALALVSFMDKSNAVVAAGIGGGITVLSQSGPTGVGGPDVAGANFATYGVPAVNVAGDVAFAASLTPGAGGATKANARGIFAASAGASLYTPLARLLDPAGATGGTFSTLNDPVLASDGGLAFAASLKGVTGPGAKTLWHRPPGGGLTLLAQGGQRPPGTFFGAQWSAFQSLAIAADSGPIFSATLASGKGGVAAANGSGVWAGDADGKLRLYFRAGQTIDGRAVKKFTLLNAVPGSVGATRSFNDAGQIAWLGTFTDKTTAIVVTATP